ncbi:hypothetical protein AYI70_g3046 [Smittium culicis]|uniref:Uncharacterized protein n=1 Tax=Smittium culicis TaxID=133412 RepID=A0A1R1Y5A6_9FUNG|nr:hypothetical protein AYI70_g3046 [Smittium culicis]
MGNVASMETLARFDNLHSGILLTGKCERVLESDVKPLMDNEKFETQLEAIKPTKRARIHFFNGAEYNLQRQYRLLISPVGGFRREPVSEVEEASNIFNRYSSGRAPLDVKASLGKAHGQSVGPEYPGEGGGPSLGEIQSPKYGATPQKDFICSTKNPVSPKSDAEENTPTKIASSAIQAEAQPRGPLDPDGKASRGKKLDDGIPAINLKDNHDKGLYDVPGFEGLIPEYSNQEVVQKILAVLLECTRLPVPCSTVRYFAESSYIHENPASSSELGTDSENQGISILGRPDNSRRIDRSMHDTHRAYTFEAYRAGILDKHCLVRADPLSENHTPWYDHRQKEDVLESSNIKDPLPTTRSRKTNKRWEDVAQMLSELYRKGTSDVGGAITGKINAALTAGAEEQLLVEKCFMDIDDIHRCERYCLGYRHWPQELFWFMEKIRGNTSNQLQRATRRSNCIQTERSGGPVGSDLLRKYYHPSIRKEIRWNYLTQTSQHSGKPMGALPEDEYQASSNVCPVSSKLGGCTEPLNCNDKMVTFDQDILSIGKEVWKARRGPLCISDQQKDTKILHLVPGPSIYMPERAATQLGRLEEPLLLPYLEPYCTDSPEGEMRADNNDCNYTRIDVGDLVSGYVRTINFTATNSTSNRGSPRSEKRKVPAHQEQGLHSNGMENQRSALKDKGVSNTAIELIFNSQRPSMDISPIIEYFREIGDNEQLNIKSVTIKTCWLLAVCGFMRASDIPRIDDAQTTTIDGTLKLVIVAPKEERKGGPNIRPCEISCHSDKLLCPVEAYKVYRSRVSKDLSPTPHINDNKIIVNRLFRYINDFNKPFSVNSITRNIHNISYMIARPPNTPTPKARAIGATIAANAEIPSDSIVAQAFWSNYEIFDSYYRLSRTASTNITQAIIPLESLNMNPSNDV